MKAFPLLLDYPRRWEATARMGGDHSNKAVPAIPSLASLYFDLRRVRRGLLVETNRRCQGRGIPAATPAQV